MSQEPLARSIATHRRPRLITHWPLAWRLWSVRIAALGAALMTAWTSLPDEIRCALPHADRVAALLFLATTVARIIAQEQGTEIDVPTDTSRQ